MVRCDQNDLEIQTGEELLTEYRFNTNVATHYFCGRCGIYTFHKMRKLPDKYAINTGCIDNIDLSVLRPTLITASQT